jgi:hypothetical protein
MYIKQQLYSDWGYCLMTPPILGILASSRLVSSNSYESIQTFTVGSGGQSTISFTSIPSTYKHLQVRIFGQTNRTVFGIDNINLILNSDSGSNYAWHLITGDGANPNAAGAASQTSFLNLSGTNGTTAGNSFSATIIDLLDYANTSKYKTGRVLSGVDINGTLSGLGGRVGLFSGLWMNTNAITRLDFTPNTGTLFTQYSSFALYGIKG